MDREHLEKIKQQMVDKNLPFYTVKYQKDICDIQDDNISPDDAAQKLDSFLSGLPYPSVQIELSGRERGKKAEGGNIRSIKHFLKLNQSSSNNFTGIAGITGNASQTYTIGQIVEIEKENERLKAKIETLEKGEQHLDNNSHNVFNTILSHPAFVPAILGLLTGKAAPVSRAVAGINQDQVADKITALLNRWAKADPKELTQVIEAIVDIAETSPDKYNLYKSMLLS
jgi:hypothetical protein